MKSIHSILSWSRRWVSGVPIVGGLAYCTWKDHKSTLSEMTIILAFATATFWLTSVFLMGFSQPRALGFPELLRSSIKSGELFIFAVGFIGPILLLTTTEEKPKHDAFPGFPGRRWHLFSIILLALVATTFHTQIKYSLLMGKPIQQDMDFAVGVSLWVGGAAVVLRYLAMVYKKAYFEPGVEIKEREDNFADSYAEHVREGKS